MERRCVMVDRVLSDDFFSDGKENIRAEFESAIDRLQNRLEDALEVLRNSLAGFEQPDVRDAIAALDQEIGDVISLARQEGGF